MVELTYLSQKKLFFVRIFDISPCVFTQISSERDQWMQNLIPHPTIPIAQNLSKKTEIYVENTNKTVYFLMTNMSSQPLWLTHFIEILLVLEFQLIRTYCWRVFL